MKKSLFTAAAVLAVCSAVVFAAPKEKYISPNNDGIQDNLDIKLNISEKRYVLGWSLVITDKELTKEEIIDSANEEHKVYIKTNTVALPTKLTFKSFFKQLFSVKKPVEIPPVVSWNGTTKSGETAPDGTYYYYITATDDNDNVGVAGPYPVVVDTFAPDIDLTQPADRIFGEGSKAVLDIKQTGSVEDEWIALIKTVDGTVVRTFKWENAAPSDISWGGTNDDGLPVEDGVYSYEITATDRAGNVAPSSKVTNIIFSAEKPVTNIAVTGSRYFSPKTESAIQSVTCALTIPLPDERSGNKLTEWSVDIKNKDGNVVRTYSYNDLGVLPPAQIEFDGTDNNGNLLANGEYQAVVHAKYLNGYVPAEAASPIIVLDTEKPSAQIRASDKVFGAGSKSDVKFSIMITPSSGAPVPSWKAEVRTAAGEVVKTFDLGAYPPETVTWNGINDKGTIAEKGNYTLALVAQDLAGNIGGGISAEEVTFDTTETQLLIAMSDIAFAPKGNSSKKTLTFSPVTQTKDISEYEFSIKDKNGKKVYTNASKGKLPAKFNWDGKDSDGVYCDDGFYSAQLTVTATNGSTAAAATSEFELDTKIPELEWSTPWTYFSPDGDGNQDSIPLTLAKSTSEKLWTAEVRDSKNKTVKKYSWSGVKPEVAWDGTDESGNICADGKYSMVIAATDDAGNSFSTTVPNIVLDTRETKLYLTAEEEGISPNGDGKLEVQEFAVKASLAEDLLAWSFDVRREDGTSVYSLSEKDSKNLPAVIKWNGADKDGNVCEGTFTGTLTATYLKGNKVSAVSSPFVCTATAPDLLVQTTPEYFSPDNDGIDDDLFIRLTGNTKAKISSWSFVIKDPKGKVFWKTEGKNQLKERIIWDGLSNTQKDASGKAERVQSAMDYPYTFTVTDSLGMTSSVSGVIAVDVLVIREGNVLKMAVPSIIFESDASNFQNANNKLSKEQVDKNVQILNRIADILKKFSDYKVTIQGHANRVSDNIDEETIDNMQQWGRALGPLSKERADAIKAYLVKRGVSASNVSTEGMGGTKPVVNPKDSDNNWKNRRVEFILVK